MGGKGGWKHKSSGDYICIYIYIYNIIACLVINVSYYVISCCIVLYGILLYCIIIIDG